MARFGVIALVLNKLQQLRHYAVIYFSANIRLVSKKYVVNVCWSYYIGIGGYRVGSIIHYKNHLGLAEHGISYIYEIPEVYTFKIKNHGVSLCMGTYSDIRIRQDNLWLDLQIGMLVAEFKLKRNGYSYSFTDYGAYSGVIKMKIKRIPFIKYIELRLERYKNAYELLNQVLSITCNLTDKRFLI